jgi:acyl-CoA reductase-like NAD-dependent aldehyde dehydrogenase
MVADKEEQNARALRASQAGYDSALAKLQEEHENEMLSSQRERERAMQQLKVCLSDPAEDLAHLTVMPSGRSCNICSALASQVPTHTLVSTPL